MTPPDKVYIARDEPHHHVNHPKKKSKPKTKRKIKLILENLINNQGDIKKVTIPTNVSMKQLKEAIGQLFNLSPDDFQLTIDDNYKHTTKTVKKVNLVPTSKENKKKQQKVKIILQSSVGPDEVQKKVQIPKDAKVSKLKSKIAEIFELSEDEFELVHVKGKQPQ